MPTLRNRRSEDLIGGSPLLENNSPLKLNKSLHSTINPDRLEQSRFSDLDEDGENPLRIVVYVVVVILIGIGSAFAVRQLISKDEPEDTVEETTDNEDEDSVQSAVTINKTALADSAAVNPPANDKFIDSAITTVGETKTATTNYQVNALEYQKYTSFGRLALTLDGMTEGETFPKTSISFDSVAKKIVLNFEGINTVAQDLQTDIEVGDLIAEVRYDAVNSDFIIFLSEDSKYLLTTRNNQVFLDIKTVRQIQIDANQPVETEEETVTETEPETTPETQNPTGQTNFDNAFSQEEQKILSTVSGNTIPFNQFYYEDQGSLFEFSLGVTGKAGDSFIPNSTAKYITEGGVNYIEWTISNLQTESFDQKGMSGTALTNANIDLSAANFVRIDRVSFTNGTAKYRIRVKYKSDFRLLSQKTIDGKDQVISIQIKD